MSGKSKRQVLELHTKHGIVLFDSALACVSWQLEAGEYGFDPFDEDHAGQAESILRRQDEAEAQALLDARDEYEYEHVEWSYVLSFEEDE